MNETEKYILTLNAGSSSIKFCAFTHHSLTKVLEGKIDRIGMEGTYLALTDCVTEDTVKTEIEESDVTALLLKIINEYVPQDSLAIIGHRVVHGGTRYSDPARIDEDVLSELQKLAPFAPRHLPAEIVLMRAVLDYFPTVPQYACFDTAYFHEIPRVAELTSLPRTYESTGVRRYGFHGLSYEFLMHTLAEQHQEPVDSKRIILAHLGSGSSLAAVKNGKPIDMTMGFTPASGVPMGTRSGDLDPGLFGYFIKTLGLTVDEFSHMVNYESGLKGVSGTTADMEVLLTHTKDDVRAEEAVAYYCYHVKKSIGALAAAMGGVDALVFTGGIGEGSAEIRRRVCAGLEFLGIAINDASNDTNAHCISNETSRVTIYMIPADEELMIARHTKQGLGLPD